VTWPETLMRATATPISRLAPAISADWSGALLRHRPQLWWLLGLLTALAVTVPAWLPWLDPSIDLMATDDGKNHLIRLYHLEWLLQRGVWYPRWVPDMFLGYGYPLFNYYAPAFYYLALALRALFRFDLWDAFRVVGVLAAVLAVAGTYSLVVTLWRRAALGILAATLVLYAPYIFQTNLYKRADVPEVLGLALVPWLLLAIWHTWRAPTPRQALPWTMAAAGVGTAELLVHNLTAILAAALAAVWVAYLTVCHGPLAKHPLGNTWHRGLLRVLLAGLTALGLSAFFWLPAAVEGKEVQLEWLQEGDLGYRNWLLDPGGKTPRQAWQYNRQTRSGLIDLHLVYPHQLTATPKLSLVQAAGGACVLLVGLSAGVAALHRRRRTRRGDAPPLGAVSPRADAADGVTPASGTAVIPFALVTVVCWGLTFTFSTPLWEGVPGLALFQFPWRMLGPLAICLAVAVAGSLATPLAYLERRAGPTGRGAAWAGLAPLCLVIGLHGVGDRPIFFADPPSLVRQIDGRLVVDEERRDPANVGTTGGREFLPRHVQVPLLSRGAFRYRDALERLYPEADWLGGLLYPLDGELRWLSWRVEPHRLTVRVANDAPTPARIGLRQSLFPGWRAWLDGQPAPIGVAAYVEEQQVWPGFMTFEVPPGEHTLAVAFGPTPVRLAAIAITLATTVIAGGALIWWLARLHHRRPLILGLVWLSCVLVVAYLSWRGVRPLFASSATLPLPAPPTGKVWRAADLDTTRAGLLVNVAEAVRLNAAQVRSPAGPTLGPDKFVDLRQLLASDEDDPARGLAATSRRQWLYLHPPSEVSVDLAVPALRQTWFQASLVIDPAVWRSPTGDGVRFQAAVTPLGSQSQSGTEVVVLDRSVNPRARTEDRGWVPVEADLSPWAGTTIRLTLRTFPRDDLTFDWSGWANPVVVVRETARSRPPAGGE
jgi:hypothetical protein